ncbi:9696_t:CDS:10 [Funneliformis geosporum]|uniref:Exocyst complex component Sec8 n=1 Tax=Funneliformis geosporum TaxID=1117311 RepID=A0A9W4WPA4_9GLOM|nr:9696_t:CDS:10 [Funneliformis geosporum]CAI2168781.1 119_t:CDS:10 [Funneliformis geosporum]
MSNYTKYTDGGYEVRGTANAKEQNRSVKNDSFLEMEAAMRQIKAKWEFMTSEEFNPVPLALELLDGSSLGKDYRLFKQMKGQLDKALQYIVNDYYQGFNSSIGTFGGVMQNIGDSQERVKEMKSQLKTCKEMLMSKRSDLLQLWFRSQQYKEMIQKLEVLLRDKHFLTAAKMLLDAIKSLEKKEMIGIGALSDLRRYLKAQQNSLHEVLIEELHNHLYLKNSYCDSRWVKYTKDQKTLPSPLMEWQSGKETRMISYMTLKNKKNLQVNTGLTMSMPLSPKSPKPLNNNITFNDEDEMIVENLDINPETDSFYYLEILIESLSTLKKLPQALETITQRIPIELYQLVDKTISEVEERNSDIFSQKSKINDVADIFSLDYPENDAQMEILRDLLWTLYSKLDAVLQGHRFILEMVDKISKRPEYQKNDSQKFKMHSFIEIWKPVQSEVRTLLRDYITEDERVSISENTSEASIQEMIKDRRAHTTLNEELNKQYKRDISTVLQNSMPEVFAKVPDERQLSVFVVDRFANANITAGHRLVIKPDAFNVSIIFKPTLAFLDKVKKIIPSSAHQSSADFTTFLDDFVFNVFLPQIGDKIFEIFRQSTAESDAFQEDPNYKTYSALPVIKSASSLMMIVESLCSMLYNMASHKEEYSKMIISLLTQYYVKCFEQYQATVSKNKGEGTVKDDANNQGISATWVQQDQLSEVLGQYPYVAEDNLKNRRKRKQLCDKETRIEMNFKRNREISLGQLITDNKKLTALANFYHSLKWFVAKIWELRGKDSKSTGNLHSTKMDDGNLAKISRRWSSYGDVNFSLNVDDEKKKENGDKEISLPLTGEMANRFDALLATFQQLAEQNLFTLRIELRCHTLHYLDKAMREGNYQLEYEAYEPDPYVLTLNADMVKFNESIASHLPTKEHKFVFEGLDALMEHSLVNNAVYIRNLNTNGVMKMTRNILALQQNLKNIVETPGDISLERARRYYEMFNMGPVNMLTRIKEQGAIFSFEEYKIMLEIMYKIDPTDMQTTPSTRRDSPSSNRRLYNENLLELNELMLDFL